MHDNFKRLIWLSGHFGIVVREHAEQLVYRGDYGRISANNTFAKLEREYNIFKRVDRGKKKTDGYKLTNLGVRKFRSLFGYEPKVYNSGDKLSHAIKILDFYIFILQDAFKRGLIQDIYINEENNIVDFYVHRQIDMFYKGRDQSLISDGFGIYKYSENKGFVFCLEIENSDRTSSYIAKKLINNYEGYYHSRKWFNEDWQRKNIKAFPPVLVVVFSEWKMKELIRYFITNMSINIHYYFTTYSLLSENGISEQIWKNVDGEYIKILK
jgi:hypothetical protein